MKSITDPQSSILLEEIVFKWCDKTGQSTLRLHDKTYCDAVAVAVGFGYTESKWYKPGSWGNQIRYSTTLSEVFPERG